MDLGYLENIIKDYGTDMTQEYRQYNNKDLLSIISAQEENMIELHKIINSLKDDRYHLLNQIDHINLSLPKSVKELISLKWDTEKLQRSLEVS